VPITYITGDATAPDGDGPRTIAHVCNDIGKWEKGFVMAISRRWKEPAQQFKEWYDDGDDFELGRVQFVEVGPQLWVANLIGQRGITKADGVPPVRYEAIRQGMAHIAKFATKNNAAVHMPRIGCGLAGGKWQEIAKIIDDELVDKSVGVTVYSLASERWRKE
jgi:O-acetyl-ADP-ribose deacetylase (regulator of RNase III)